MKMTTEEAFVKTLQMHGIEHAFGIIGSAFMPISDIFPAAGITFWDCAHEGSGGMMADGYTRATGKMSMMIAQNGPGITNFVTAVKTAYWNHTPLLLVTPQAANKTIGQGGFQEIEQMNLFEDMRRLSGRGPRPVAHRRGAEPRDPASAPPARPRPDQHAARLLDAGDRHRPCPKIVTFERPSGGEDAIARGRQAAVLRQIPGHPERRGRGAGGRNPGLDEAGRTARCAGLLRLPAQRRLPRLAPAVRRPARLQRLEGRDGADLPGRCRALPRHKAEPVLDPARLRHRLLAEGRQDHPGRYQPRPHRPDQEGQRRHRRRRQKGRHRDPRQALGHRRRRRSRRPQGEDRTNQIGLGAAIVQHGPRG